MTIRDTIARYGTISRLFHWCLAALFLWQFASAFAHWALEDTAVEAFLFSTHQSLGFAILLLALPRGAWGLANMDASAYRLVGAL